jgi:DNA-binding GntR family transcriptional regulator
MHEQLLAALEAGDAAAAEDIMAAHYRELDLNFDSVIFNHVVSGQSPGESR